MAFLCAGFTDDDQSPMSPEVVVVTSICTRRGVHAGAQINQRSESLRM
jgi:hypothetical protein